MSYSEAVRYQDVGEDGVVFSCVEYPIEAAEVVGYYAFGAAWCVEHTPERATQTIAIRSDSHPKTPATCAGCHKTLAKAN